MKLVTGLERDSCKCEALKLTFYWFHHNSTIVQIFSKHGKCDGRHINLIKYESPSSLNGSVKIFKDSS